MIGFLQELDMLIVTFLVCTGISLKTLSCEWLTWEQLFNSSCSTYKYSMFAAWTLLYRACQFANVKDSSPLTFLNGLLWSSFKKPALSPALLLQLLLPIAALLCGCSACNPRKAWALLVRAIREGTWTSSLLQKIRRGHLESWENFSQVWWCRVSAAAHALAATPQT